MYVNIDMYDKEIYIYIYMVYPQISTYIHTYIYIYIHMNTYTYIHIYEFIYMKVRRRRAPDCKRVRRVRSLPPVHVASAWPRTQGRAAPATQPRAEPCCPRVGGGYCRHGPRGEGQALVLARVGVWGARRARHRQPRRAPRV